MAALLGHEAALFLPTATMANQIALKLHSRPGDVLIAEQHAHVVIYEYGGAAAHAGLMTSALPGDRRDLSPEEMRGASRARARSRRPAAASLVAREHPQRLGRACLAAGRARGRGRGRARARARRPPRRRPPAQRAVALGVPPAAIAGALRHGDALPLEGPRLPARCAARGLTRADRARVAREAPLRRRDAPGGDRRGRRASTRSTTTSTGSPRITPARAASPKAGSTPGCPSTSTRSRRTSCRSTSALGLGRRGARAAARRGRRALVDDRTPTCSAPSPTSTSRTRTTSSACALARRSGALARV